MSAPSQARRPSQASPRSQKNGLVLVPAVLVSVLPDLAGLSSAKCSAIGIGAASLPTNEIQGAQPHEHSGGAGALPGNSTEPAVAVVPDEKHGGDFKETAELAGAGAAAAGMGKWALDDRSQQQQSKVGEDMHLADSAKSAGAESAGGATQPQQPMKETPKEAPKEELKKEESKEKKLPHGKGNQVSSRS